MFNRIKFLYFAQVPIDLSEEDSFGTYSKLMLKYFLAEGVVCHHDIFLAGGDTSAETLLRVSTETYDDSVCYRKSFRNSF